MTQQPCVPRQGTGWVANPPSHLGDNSPRPQVLADINPAQPQPLAPRVTLRWGAGTRAGVVGAPGTRGKDTPGGAEDARGVRGGFGQRWGGEDRRSPGRQRGHTDTPECKGSLGSPGPPCSPAMQTCQQEVTGQRRPRHPNIPAGKSQDMGSDRGTWRGIAALLRGTGTELAGPLPPAGEGDDPGCWTHHATTEEKLGQSRAQLSLPPSDHRPH